MTHQKQWMVFATALAAAVVLAGVRERAAESDLTMAKAESVGMSTQAPAAHSQLHPGLHGPQRDRRRGHAGRASRQDRPFRCARLTLQGSQCADAEGHDLLADVDDQADRLDGADDALRRRALHARRSDCQLAAVVREQAGPRSGQRPPRADGAADHDPSRPHPHLGTLAGADRRRPQADGDAATVEGAALAAAQLAQTSAQAATNAAARGRPKTLAEAIERAASYPLAFQPGERWQYGSSTDFVAVLVEKMTGMTIDQFLRERMFQPLGMTDTHYNIPREKVESCRRRLSAGSRRPHHAAAQTGISRADDLLPWHRRPERHRRRLLPFQPDAAERRRIQRPAAARPDDRQP